MWVKVVRYFAEMYRKTWDCYGLKKFRSGRCYSVDAFRTGAENQGREGCIKSIVAGSDG